MAKIFLLHWNEAEANERASTLESAGHDVVVHWNTDSGPPLKDNLPDIAVISLDRLPSHGRAVAEWLWEAKKRQHIPIIFAGGEPAKLAVTRAQFPKALYCTTAAMVREVAKLTRHRSPKARAATRPLAHGSSAKGVARPKARQTTSRAREHTTSQRRSRSSRG